MEILILLIVAALLASLVLGPVGCFKSFALSKTVGRLQREVDRLAEQLQDTQAVCHKLRADFRANGASGLATQDAAQADSRDPLESESEGEGESEAKPETLAATQPLESTPSIELDDQPDTTMPIDAEPTTLERLRELRHEQAQQETVADANADTDTDSSQEDDSLEPLPAAPAAIQTTDPSGAAQADEPARRLTIEEVLAGKVFVWIGAIALVLTAAFLLKLGFDRNIITEPVRVLGTAAFGIALWCVGEWARARVSLIAQALCGAAVAVLYASVLSAHNLYGLFGPSGEAIAFALMATITAAAILLSLRHGPAVAILGMLGGFMLPPLLMQTFSPNAGMILYLLAIEIGILAITGKRGWFGISAMTLLFTVAWSLGYALIGDDPLERTLTAMLILGTAAAYLFHTARIHRDPSTSPTLRKRVLALSITATCSAIAIVALLAVQGGYTLQDLGMLWLVALGTLILARLDARQLAMPFIAMALSLLVLFAHAAQSLTSGPSDLLITMAASFGGLFMLGGYICLWRNQHRRVFAVMAAIAGPAFYGLVMFAGHEAYGLREFWWPCTLTLAGLYALATLPMLLRRKAEYDWPIALFSVLSFALVCITLGQAIDHPWFAVCLAAVSAVAAMIDLRLFIRPLRVAACWVSFGSAVLLVVPGPFEVAITGGAVFNTLLPMYLLPALAFAISAWCAKRTGSALTASILTYLCCATVGVMLVALTRDAFHPLNFSHEGFALFEWSTLACVLLLAAMAGQMVGRRLQLDAVLECVLLCVGIAGAIAVIAGVFTSNPLFNGDVVAGPIFALQLAGLYLAPAALLWLWSRSKLLANTPPLGSALRVGSILLTALFVAMQLRNVFHLDDLHALRIGAFECATYGLAWVALGFFFHFIAPRCTPRQATAQAGRAIFGIGLGILLIGNALILNPLWHPVDVGTLPVLNGLWYLFGPTILILALLARHARQTQQILAAKLAGFIAIGLSFMLLSTLVRHGFSADGYARIASNLANSERYAYSLAWVVFGGVLLIAGVFTKLDTMRYGSLAILLLAVGKVFLIDTANLDNLYRVFSFFGLGVTLIALGYLYQRLVFKRPHDQTKAAPQP